MTSVAAPPDNDSKARGYRWWVAGSIASITGDAAFNIALGWQATEFGGSYASIILALPGLVAAALLLFAGVATDRYSPRRVLLWSSAGFVVAAAAMTLLSADGRTGTLWLIAFACVIGVRTAIFSPASVALTRQLVPPDRFGNALSLRQLITQLASVLGRPLGGALVLLGGLAAAGMALTVAYGAALVSVIRTRAPDAPTRTADRKESKTQQLFGGVTVILKTPVLLQLVLITGAAAGLLLPLATLLVPIWVRHNNGSALNAGWIVGLIAAASIAVATLVSWRGPHQRLGATAAIGLAIVAIATLGFLSESSVLASAAALFIGLGQGLFATHAAPLVKAVPQEHMGRVQSVLTLAQTLAASAGTLALGALTTALSIGPAVAIWSGALALTAVAALTVTDFRRARAN